MRGLIAFLFLCMLCCILGLTPSPGCGKSSPINTGTTVTRTIRVVDPNLPAPDRSYITYVPNSYNINTPMPLLVWFHGQYGSAQQDANRNLDYTDLPMISIYLQGLEDGNCGTGFNVGWKGGKSACQSNGVSDGCCYSSCRQLGYCTGDGRNQNNCGWSTCYDDATFTSDLMYSIGNELCIDLDKVLASGWSNGGMMIHWLATEFPDTFSAVMPVYGLPLEGFDNVPNALSGTAILSLHPRNDRVIPVEGGNGGGWLYISTSTIIGKWASVHGCSSSATSVSTPYDGGSKNFACTEYTGCSSGKRIMRCLYDGGHGSELPNMEEMSWWFFQQSFLDTNSTTDRKLPTPSGMNFTHITHM